ncbi:tail fiber domain-containing protein [Salmonella enterica subsp. enterica serovar Senftenberg]|uniref:tail fiber domain-containing protein n=1 Tax=Salmonella sp. NW884 TaxID=2948363 RepID=UPI0012835D98|nr:tail fiber domain-containing protein [Salmonella enterica]EAS6470856.1 tail fiber domain-containing protein [Salmonella enterica subsp. enterica serovar Senftenberg]EBO1347858.1 tail fiber domain-containing protein [Salmonella enterica subsp. enterica]EBT6021319.1 tail fiber domain-containing protein [Salmonella enterica subsp. enterica serovar Thomasville]ECJ5283724.1 tail fiber domain-containing protein [Salmonella enterica subsp. enterica serovar Anatum]EDT8903627.1 tail fiber domain-con
MSAGTLTLTNDTDAVTGSGTAFTAELAAGDFIVVTVGGIPYTLPVKAVNNNTSLTLVSVYTGPTQSGAAWSAVPRVALNMVTAALVAQSAEALRGLNYDKQNWQQFFTADGDVTITLPDTSQTTGPSAKKLINSVSDKAKKGNNSDITSLTGLTTPLSVAQGGTGGATPADAANNIGLGQKSSPFFSQLNISTTGFAIIGVQNTSRGATDVGARVSIEASVAANSRGSIIQKNNQNTPENQIESLLPSSPGVLAVQGTSGREYKKDIEDADTCEAMRRIMGLRMVNFVYKDDELARVRFGIIAEEAEDVAPQYVKHNQFPVPGSQVYNEEGQLVNQQYADRPSIDNNPIVMDLLGCIQNLQAQITELKLTIAALQK